nr:signal peptidase II [Adlercreutzia sp. ZJ242]
MAGAGGGGGSATGAAAPVAAPAAPVAPTNRRARNLAAFCAVACAWLALDVVSKRAFNAYEPGELIAGPFAGVFQLRLVHNTGAAWGMFGDMTFALGVLAVVVCGALLAYAAATARTSSLVMNVGLALVFAGGIGNALDRFALGYVVDFIEPVFIDFPVFNVADIGVTCGVVLVFAALALEWRQEKRS